MKGLLLRSIEKRDKIVIFYIDSKNQVSQRFIRVISMNDDYIVAFCYWRKKVRTFRYENILSVGPIRKRAGA
jgi:predicted DNA-binding transcriptional regulator YafY